MRIKIYIIMTVLVIVIFSVGIGTVAEQEESYVSLLKAESLNASPNSLQANNFQEATSFMFFLGQLESCTYLIPADLPCVDNQREQCCIPLYTLAATGRIPRLYVNFDTESQPSLSRTFYRAPANTSCAAVKPEYDNEQLPNLESINIDLH
ncbi:MAG: hypothetical protein ACRC2T_11750 [Thermoguttaceae bacterium]